MGEGNRLIEEVKELEAASPAFRLVRVTLTPDTPNIFTGISLGTLAEGEWVVSFQLGVTTAWDGDTPGVGVGTTEESVPADLSGGRWDLSSADTAAGGGAADSGLIAPVALAFPSQQNVGPAGGIGMVLKVSSSGDANPGSTEGLAYAVLIIAAGYDV